MKDRGRQRQWDMRKGQQETERKNGKAHQSGWGTARRPGKAVSDKVYANEAKAGFLPHPLFMTWFYTKWLLRGWAWAGDDRCPAWGRGYTRRPREDFPDSHLRAK